MSPGSSPALGGAGGAPAGTAGASAGAPSADAAAAGIPTGNTYDKYGARNPTVRRIMRRFEATIDDLLASTAPASILDVGCGEGVLTERWAAREPGRRVVGVDLEDPGLRGEWASRPRPNLEFRVANGEALPFEDGEFDVATAIEVLEHVDDPPSAIAEMARCATRHLIVSVPREPLWRALNVLRGAYWQQLGNTPGHLNHWSKRTFVRLLSQHGEVVEARSPLPWTVLLVRL